MKNAAKCDTSCDLQNPVNHQTFERTLRPRVTPRAYLSECPQKTKDVRGVCPAPVRGGLPVDGRGELRRSLFAIVSHSCVSGVSVQHRLRKR
jgi:hypothetical protein